MLDSAKPSGSVKMTQEDFRVQEVVQGRVVQPVFETSIVGPHSDFTEFTLTKQGVPGKSAYEEIARQLDVPIDRVTYYCLKDAQAVTAQTIVVEGQFRPTFEHNKIWLQQKGPNKGPLQRGAQDGNRFTIFVETDAQDAPRKTRFINLFGPQRFGQGSPEIGKYLLEGNFPRVLELLKGTMDWRQLEPLVARGLSAEEVIFQSNLDLEFMVGKWWSWLWNQLAPLTDEHYLPTWSPESAYMYVEWWNPIDLDEEMFELMHNFSRPVWVEATNHQVLRKRGGFEHSFTLRSGSYATVFLASLYDLKDVSRQKYEEV